MKISTHLPHFQEPTLFISAGKQEATFFLAENDVVNQIQNLKIPKPEYTDKESRTERRHATGTMFGGGSPFKHIEDELVRSFVRRLVDETEKLIVEHRVTKIYLFCPTYLSNQIEDNMPTEIQKTLEYIFYGNYHHQHPFVLLSKILELQKTETEKNKIEPITGEALNILKNTSGPFKQFENRLS